MSLILSGTEGLSDVDGSAATPAIRGTDANTGIFFPAADTIAFAEGGAEAARFDSSGQLGIGTTSPAGKLHVVGAQNAWSQVIAGNTTSAQSYGMRIQAGTTSADTSLLIRDATNAIDYLTVIGNGNVGVANSAPSAKLQVDASNFALATLYNTLSSNFAVRTTTSAAANVGGEIALGGYSNGTSSPCDFARIHGKKENGTAGNVSGYLAFEVSYDGGPSPYIFERARIDSSGNLLVGATSTLGSTAGILVANGGANVQALTTNSTSSSPYYIGRFYSGGTEKGYIYFDGTNVSYTNLSDYRLKDDVQPMQNALDKVAQLNPVTYNWKANGKAGQGFIAHELQAVIPDCVTGEKDAVETQQYEISPAVPATFDEDGNELTPAIEAVMGEREVPKYQGVDTSFLVATLTAAMQEMKALIDTQASTITQLTARITALESA
jgi:hypothetical protein